MIGYFLESTQVGYYRAITPFKEVAIFVLTSFSFLFFPIASQYYNQGKYDKLEDLYVASTKWATILTSPLILTIGLFSRDIIRVLLGAEYTPGASALSILVVGLFFRTVVGLNGDMVRIIDQTKIEMNAALLGLMVNLVLNAVLIPKYGIEGAAIATVSGFIIFNLFEVIAIYREIRIHPFKLQNFKQLLIPLITGYVLAQLVIVRDLGLVELILIGISLVVVQLISTLTTDSLNETDWEVLRMVEKETGLSFQWLLSIFNR
jgi:O-antigen/teichoic acid export membrane protein